MDRREPQWHASTRVESRPERTEPREHGKVAEQVSHDMIDRVVLIDQIVKSFIVDIGLGVLLSLDPECPLIVGAPGADPSTAEISSISSSSSAAVQPAKRSAMRVAISAAAVLVKVRQSMRSGGVPLSSKLNTRSVSTLVLPVPAEAATQTEA